MIQVIYRWNVPLENQAAFIEAWENTTVGIRDTTVGARGSICVASVDRPTEILTIAKWDELAQWQAFIERAKSTTMRAMHELGRQLSHDVYEQKGDFTV